MLHRYDVDLDTLLHQDDAITAYLKPRDEPVYAVEPTGVDAEHCRATVILLHGLCEHAFRFFHVAKRLAARGIQTVLPQLYGHGIPLEDIALARWLAEAYLLSDDPADVLGGISRRALASRALGVFHDHNVALLSDAEMIDRLRVHCEQVYAVGAQLYARDNARPLFLMGHSLGGLIAAEVGWQFGHSGSVITPRGVVMINPALQPIGKSPLETGILNLGWLVANDPDLQHVDRAIHKVTSLNFPINVAWSSRAVSDIPDENRLHAADPLTLRRLPSGYLQAIQRQMAITDDRAADYPPDVDVLTFASRGDQIVNTEGAERFMSTLHEHRDADANPFVLFEDCPAHDPTRSTRREQVLSTIETWIDARL